MKGPGYHTDQFERAVFSASSLLGKDMHERERPTAARPLWEWLRALLWQREGPFSVHLLLGARCQLLNFLKFAHIC